MKRELGLWVAGAVALLCGCGGSGDAGNGPSGGDGGSAAADAGSGSRLLDATVDAAVGSEDARAPGDAGVRPDGGAPCLPQTPTPLCCSDDGSTGGLSTASCTGGTLTCSTGALCLCGSDVDTFFCTDFCGSDIHEAPTCQDGQWQCPPGLNARSDQCPATCWGSLDNTNCCDTTGNPTALSCGSDGAWFCSGESCCAVVDGGCRLDLDASTSGQPCPLPDGGACDPAGGVCQVNGAGGCAGAVLSICLEGVVESQDCAGQGKACVSKPDGESACQ